jgi:hypothetical protein
METKLLPYIHSTDLLLAQHLTPPPLSNVRQLIVQSAMLIIVVTFSDVFSIPIGQSARSIKNSSSTIDLPSYASIYILFNASWEKNTWKTELCVSIMRNVDLIPDGGKVSKLWLNLLKFIVSILNFFTLIEYLYT